MLVVDLGMPEMDGFELITRLRKSTNPAIRRIPAAALTAFARSEDRTKALRSGFEMHLAKPVDPGELVASVATLARRVERHTSGLTSGKEPAMTPVTPGRFYFCVSTPGRCTSYGAPVPDPPRNSFVPSGSVRSRPFARFDPSFD